MKYFSTFAWSWILAVGIVHGQDKTPPAKAPPAKTPLLQDGMLQRVKPQLEQILQFTLDGSRLKVDRKRWGDPPKEAPKAVLVFGGNAPPVEQIFHQMRAVAGVGGSSMSMGNRFREIRFTGNALNCRLMTRDDLVRLDLEEVGAPGRTLEFQDDGQGSIRLTLHGGDGGDLIVLQQTKSGTFTVAAVVAGKTLIAQGPSFLAAYKQHRAALEASVLPVLNELSIRLFVPPSSQELRRAALAILSRTPQLEQEGKKLIADLDSDQFMTRDKASKFLSDRFEVYKDLIESKLKEPNLSVETERRLQKILSAHADSHKIGQVITALELLQDPAFLVDLLQEAGTDQRGPVVAQLEKVTGQRLGNNVEAWKQWLESKK